jgi:[protein-PII] uridylyltransferase
MDTKLKQRDIFELTALDKPGLLAKITRVFREQGIMLYSAKITTIGEKAEDIFKVSSNTGEKLTDEQKADLITALKNELN